MAATHFQSVLEDRINKEIEARSQSLANGDASDLPNYRESVGYIRGLRAAINLCSDIEQDYNK